MGRKEVSEINRNATGVSSQLVSVALCLSGREGGGLRSETCSERYDMLAAGIESMEIYKTTPWEHQRREVEGHWMDPERLLVWSPRTGKSKVVIDSVVVQVLAGGFDRLVIVAPNSVHENWILNEFPAHCSIPFTGYVWDSRRAKTQAAPAEWDKFLDSPGLKIFSINKEALLVGRCVKYIKQFACSRPCGVVIDEAHHFGSPGARISSRMKGLARHCVWRRALTGTPINNSPLRFYAICNILRNGACGYTNYEDFKGQYATYSEEWSRKFLKWHRRPTGYKNVEELIERVREFGSLVRREECPDLPALIEETRVFRMTDAQRARYEALRGAVNAGEIPFQASIPKLLAITSNFGYPKEENPRLDVLLSVLEESDEKAIIWCQYKEEIRNLVQVLGGKAVAYYGDIKRSDRLWAMQQFRDNPNVRYLIGQPQCAGEGLNISAADIVIWFSNTFDLRVYDQAVERATQMGKRTVSVVRIVAKDSVDESIFRAHRFKRNVMETCYEEWEKQDAQSKGERKKPGRVVPRQGIVCFGQTGQL